MMIARLLISPSLDHRAPYQNHDWKRRLLRHDLAVLRAGQTLLQDAIAERNMPASVAFLAHGCNTYAAKVSMSIALLGGMAAEW